MTEAVTLPWRGTFEAWRGHARRLAGHDISADDVEWVMEGESSGLFGSMPPARGAEPRKIHVSKSFLSFVRKVTSHSDPARFNLAYDALLRVQKRADLLSDRTDSRVARMHVLEKSVRRDMHKMKAFVRFREVREAVDGRRQFVSWFEPEHNIVEPITGFFVRRFADMDWVIATPRMTVLFRKGEVSYDLTPRQKPDLEDPTEELWTTYFANIFNPARLKINAMTSEMPKKYWKNLPEAALIPELIAGAEARVRDMALRGPSIPPARAAAISERLQAAQTPPAPDGGLDGLNASISRCERCPIGACATQAVTGVGPRDADVMFVGEQPGDQEDLRGQPFVGPAGQLLDRAFVHAGIFRQEHYLTNAVKHFKFTPRGKRRIHQNPAKSEIEACKWWLDQEIALVKPKLIVALGGSAVEALTGTRKGLMVRRGKVEAGPGGVAVLVTVHPSYILRLPAGPAREAGFDSFVADLRRLH